MSRSIFQALQCDIWCLPWHELCANNHKCLSKYLKCQAVTKAAPNETYRLVGHVDIDMLHSSLFPLANFLNETVVLIPTSAQSNGGDWIIHLSDGRSINLTTVIGGLVAEKSTRVRFVPTDANSYGARKLHYYKLSGVKNKSKVPISNGDLIGHQVLSSAILRTAVLLIRPVGRSERLKARGNPPNISFPVNGKTAFVSSIRNYLNFDVELKDYDIPQVLYPFIDQKELELFYRHKAVYKTYKPTAKVDFISSGGTWYAKNLDDPFRKDMFALYLGAVLPVFSTGLYFAPLANFDGIASLRLNVCYCNLPSQGDNVVTIHIPVEVSAVKNKPLSHVKFALLPPIAYDTAKSSNDGFKVSILRKFVYNVEPRDLGIAVYYASKSTNGRWLYKISGHSWTAISQRVPVNSSSIEVARLGPNDDLKFELKDASSYWSYSEAVKQTRLHFMFWNMIDFKRRGMDCFLFSVFCFLVFVSPLICWNLGNALLMARWQLLTRNE